MSFGPAHFAAGVSRLLLCGQLLYARRHPPCIRAAHMCIAQVLRYCLQLGLTQKDGYVAFKPVLDALIKHNYIKKGITLEEEGGDSEPRMGHTRMGNTRRSSMGASRLCAAPRSHGLRCLPAAPL